jgi:NAD(P)-dependent dehydrogenase (short-subunit alcohol dehydrogenase family)
MKTALITGANRGLGFEASKQLAELGFKVFMGCRDEAKGNLACDELVKVGLDVEFIKLDVTKTKDVRKVHDIFREEGRTLDVLINNAGVFLESLHDDPSISSVLKVDPVIIMKTIEANTMGPLNLIQSRAPLMIKQGHGRIINISSGMGALTGMEGFWPGYRMSKAALNVLTLITSEELKDTNISINSVCPGWCRSDMGGQSAPRSLSNGVETTIWLATCDSPPHGKFLQDKKEVPW